MVGIGTVAPPLSLSYRKFEGTSTSLTRKIEKFSCLDNGNCSGACNAVGSHYISLIYWLTSSKQSWIYFSRSWSCLPSFPRILSKFSCVPFCPGIWAYCHVHSCMTPCNDSNSISVYFYCFISCLHQFLLLVIQPPLYYRHITLPIDFRSFLRSFKLLEQLQIWYFLCLIFCAYLTHADYFQHLSGFCWSTWLHWTAWLILVLCHSIVIWYLYCMWKLMKPTLPGRYLKIGIVNNISRSSAK